MDCECPVCYSDSVSCKLVCGHGFCKSCVKTWYHKSDDPSCPMCRHSMYFKGMRKVIKSWEQERIDKKNEEAFGQAFDEIFFEEDTSSFDDDDESTTSEEEEGWVTDIEEEEEPTGGGYHTQEDEEPPPLNFTSWKFNYSQFILDEIKQLQKDYQKAMDLGVDFDWYLDNIEYFDIEQSSNMYIEDDIFPYMKNLFVSRYTGGVSQNKRNSARISLKNDKFFTFVVSLVF